MQQELKDFKNLCWLSVGILHCLEKSSLRDSSRELSNKRDSQGNAVIGNKYDREKMSYPRDENKRIPQQHDNKRLPSLQENKRLPQQHTPDGKRSHHSLANTQPNSHIVKTTSANTNAVSTTIHR